MELGLFTDSVPQLTFEQALDLAAGIGATGIEVAVAGASSSPHADRALLLADADERRRFLGAIEGRGLRLAALNCSGFPMHPVTHEAERHGVEETIRLAGALGVDKIVAMAGNPGDGPGSTTINWVWYPWPDDAMRLLERHWEQAIAFWQSMSRIAEVSGVTRIAFELHPLAVVYNVPTLLRMREAVGPVIGANIDPSHLFWQQMDPTVIARVLGPAVHHVHVKDTEVVQQQVALAGVLDQRPFDDPSERAWVFRTVGRGHGVDVWDAFLEALDEIGYRDVVSIENEDAYQGAVEGVEEAAAFIRARLSRHRHQPR